MAVDREKILQSAQKLVDKKKYDKAIAEYRKLVADDPGDVRTLLKIGDLHLKLDQFEDAISTYEQVGEYYFREGFAVKAIAVYKQIRGIINRHAPQLETKYGHIVPRLAEIYTQLGLTSDALAAYDEVATRMRQEGRERDALDIFKKVVELDPQNPIAHLRVADSRARLGDIDKAVDAFGEAARIMLKLSRLDDALKVLDRLLEYRQDPEYARLAGQTYLERNGPNDAMSALTKLQLAFKANPKDLETLNTLARAFDAINQPKKAVEVLKEAARIARDKGEESEFLRLAEVLGTRAADDPQVKQLLLQTSGRPSVEVVAVEETDVDESESMDEVFELADGDLQMEEAALAGEGNEPTLRQLLSDSEKHRVAGRMQDAITLLRNALAGYSGADGAARGGPTSPAATQLRMKLSDLLLEAGDQRGAVMEKLVLARELEQQGARDRAVLMLDEVLLLYPGHPAAVQMRSQLGYNDGAMTQQAMSTANPFDGMPMDGPLQSYDVESGGVDEVLHRGTSSQTGVMRQDSGYDPLDDIPPDSFGPPIASRRTSHNAVMLPGAVLGIDERALEEAELCADLGRIDEARAILTAQLQINPNHPLILDRLADLDTLIGPPLSLVPPSPLARAAEVSAAQVAQGYAADPRQSWAGYEAPPPAPAAGYPAAAGAEGYEQQNTYAPTSGAYDAGQGQAAYDAQGYEAQYSGQYQEGQYQGGQYQEHAPHPQPAQGHYPPAPYQAQAPAAPSRGGVHAAIPEGDKQTPQDHYDLGVAYMEMGIASNAINSLSLAARDPARECVCLSMVATIHLQIGEIDAGLDALHRALNAQLKTRDQELALGYEIANTYEAKGMAQEALHYFDWLTQLDPSYADPRGTLAERVHRLRAGSGPQPRPSAVASPYAAPEVAAPPGRKR